MRTCVVSLQISSAISHARDPGCKRLLRLEESLKRVGYSGDFIAWRDNYPPGSPTHFESPWGFKVFCLMEARNAGYDAALWLDSSAVAIRPLNHIFNLIADRGYCLFKNHDYIIGEWSGDVTLRRMSITREEAFGMSEIYGGAMGFSFSSSIAMDFLNKLHRAAADGIAFRGVETEICTAEEFERIRWNHENRISSHPRVRGHRHDQTVSGILAHRLNMVPSIGIVTDNIVSASANPDAAILFERSRERSLSNVINRVFVIERVKAPIRAMLKNGVKNIFNPIVIRINGITGA